MMTDRFHLIGSILELCLLAFDIKRTNTSNYDDKNETVDPSILLSVRRLISTSCLIIQMCQFEWAVCY